MSIVKYILINGMGSEGSLPITGKNRGSWKQILKEKSNQVPRYLQSGGREKWADDAIEKTKSSSHFLITY